MFQIFDPVSDRSYARKNLPLVRKQLSDQNLDGFLVPHDDEYQNEYIPAYAERLMWTSGFSGSAGFAIIMQESAVIFVDGRYTLQVRDQVDESYYQFEDITDTPPSYWLTKNTKAGMKIGYDPMLHSVTNIRQFESAAKKSGFILVPALRNPVDLAWEDQPAKPEAAIVPHAVKFSGTQASKKRTQIQQAIKDSGADACLVTAPPSVAWAFNIRGGDVDRSPLPLSRAIFYADGQSDLFFDQAKSSNSLVDHLGDDVNIIDEARINDQFVKLGRKNLKILVDPSITPTGYVQQLQENGATIITGEDPCALPRACKNSVEIDGTRNAHIRDGAAVTEFLYWLDTKAQDGSADEISAAKMLESIRLKNNDLKDLSFDTISAAGPNGASPHYRVNTQSNLKLETGTLYLVDSGGQYMDGTTDITRTVAIGTPTDEMRDRFTQVLKGHIALATIHFPTGTTGHQLDVLARQPLWQMGLDYDHGTGHGVGSYLGVHEGPQRIAKWVNTVALQPGMILSNEPGYYKSGEYGIRIENLIVVNHPAPIKGGEREMMSFETITLAPIARNLINKQLLTEEEINWMDAYHQRVRETLTPLVPENIRSWLQEQTRPL